MDTYKNKNVLITGGAGFVGSKLARALVDENANVVVYDDFSTGSLRNLEGISSKISIVNADVCDFALVSNYMRLADYIFHLAARNIVASTKDPVLDYKTNIGGTLNILLRMKENESDFKRLIYISSASVYGNPRYLPINEDDQINLLTPYAVSKYAGEGYCMAFHESYNIPVTVLRLSNVYGPYQDPSNPYCGVVAKFMYKAKRFEHLEIHGDGLSTRDFTYVDDVIRAIMLAGLSEKAEGEVFNIATGIETPVIELARSIRDLYWEDQFHKSDIQQIDRRDIDNIRRRVLNIEKARKKLNWIPEITLDVGLRLTKEWMRTIT